MIYRIDKTSKAHEVVASMPDFSDGHYYVKADADGWIQHTGKECPLPDGARYEVKNRDGEWGEGVVGKWVHGSYQREYDIIAYRPIRDAEPSELEATNRTPESAAIATLEKMGYGYFGGELWNPPLGERPACLDDEPEAPEWDGEGDRPTTGSVCMVRSRSADGASCPAVIKFMSEQSCVWSWRDDGMERTMHAHPSELEFRPIRTPAQWAEEAMFDLFNQHAEITPGKARTLAAWAAKAIRDGKIPGVKLEDKS